MPNDEDRVSEHSKSFEDLGAIS